MARRASTHPTELELEILKVIWRDGASTVRQVREALEPARKLAHTSVITIMNIMTEKGYLSRETEANVHTYSPRVTEKAVRKNMLGDVVRRVFDGSPVAVMLNLLESSKLKDDELAELRGRLEELRKDA